MPPFPNPRPRFLSVSSLTRPCQLKGERVLRNPVVMGIMICHSIASAIIAGTVIFVAKYMENQFGITASLALFLRGSIEVPLICLSFFVGGTFMSRSVESVECGECG